MGINGSAALSLKLAREGYENAIDKISQGSGEFDGRTIKSLNSLVRRIHILGVLICAEC